jgi:hypothetical protein
MESSTPWAASKYHRWLPIYKALKEVIEDGLTPDPDHYEAWAKRSLAEQLSQAFKSQDAIWESVLGLWRLKYLEPTLETADEQVKTLWRLHASAWLVSADKR